MQAEQTPMMSKLNSADGNNSDLPFCKRWDSIMPRACLNSKEYLVHAEHPQLKNLCGKMKSSQQQQLTAMNAWTKAWK